MGYRSQVVVLVACESKDDLQKIIDQLPDETKAAIGPYVRLRHDGAWATFEFDNEKWYTERLIGFRENGYEVANAVEDFVQLAESLNNIYDVDPEEGVRSTGALVRAGEESNDTEEWHWGEPGDGLPEWYDYLHLTVLIEVDWDE